MSEIKFDFECWPPFGEVEIIANDDGSGVLVIDKESDDEIEWSELTKSDQDRIRAKVREWVDHYRAMDIDRPHDPRPENDAFGAEYVRGLNKDMGKD